jgi:hypothetical protein
MLPLKCNWMFLQHSNALYHLSILQGKPYASLINLDINKIILFVVVVVFFLNIKNPLIKTPTSFNQGLGIKVLLNFEI